MKTYPILETVTLESLANVLRYIIRERNTVDVNDFNNLSNVFMRGRKVGKIPIASSDVTGSRLGDFNYTATHLYVCVDNAGVVEWRRVALSAF